MFAKLFESQQRQEADAAEVARLKQKYGDELETVLRARLKRNDLSMRSRRHWQRILRKAINANAAIGV